MLKEFMIPKMTSEKGVLTEEDLKMKETEEVKMKVVKLKEVKGKGKAVQMNEEVTMNESEGVLEAFSAEKDPNKKLNLMMEVMMKQMKQEA